MVVRKGERGRWEVGKRWGWKRWGGRGWWVPLDLIDDGEGRMRKKSDGMMRNLPYGGDDVVGLVARKLRRRREVLLTTRWRRKEDRESPKDLVRDRSIPSLV